MGDGNDVRHGLANAVAGGGFKACVGAGGNTTCPAAFPTKHLLGTGASFSCSGGCTCSVTGACSGTLSYYASVDCTGSVSFQIVANGNCVATNYGSYGSHKYTPGAPTGVACTTGGSAMTSAPSLSGTTTVCCN